MRKSIPSEMVAELLLENDKGDVYKKQIERLVKKYRDDPEELGKALVEETRDAFVHRVVAALSRDLEEALTKSISFVLNGNVDWKKVTETCSAAMGMDPSNFDLRDIKIDQADFETRGIPVYIAFRKDLVHRAYKEKMTKKEIKNSLIEMFSEAVFWSLSSRGFRGARELVDSLVDVIDWESASDPLVSDVKRLSKL